MRLLAVQRPCLTRLSEMKVFAGLVTNDQPAVRQMISQRMASGQTHVNIFSEDQRKLIDAVSENNTQRV
jgi:hypothetical protein